MGLGILGLFPEWAGRGRWLGAGKDSVEEGVMEMSRRQAGRDGGRDARPTFFPTLCVPAGVVRAGGVLRWM